MTRVELKDKLRAIIIGMGLEAGEMTGIRNKLTQTVNFDINPIMHVSFKGMIKNFRESKKFDESVAAKKN